MKLERAINLMDEDSQGKSEEVFKDGVVAPHHLRTRRIGNSVAIEVHIRMDGGMSLTEAHQITTEVETRLENRFGETSHINIYTEPIK